MFKHYLKLAVRHLIFQKKYSLINIAGLSAGFTVVILISIFVFRELSYDSFHKQAKNIYQLEMFRPNENNEIEYFRTISWEDALFIKEKIPEIKKITLLNFKMINEYNGITFAFNNQLYKTNNIVFCDSSFSDFFNFELIRGNMKQAFSLPNSVVLTESFAVKIFGKEDPISKVIHTKNASWIVMAILKDPPDNSSIQFTGLIPYAGARMALGNEISDASNTAFILLDPKTDIEIISNKIRQVFYSKIKDYDSSKEFWNNTKIHLLQLKDIYFRNPQRFEEMRSGNKSFTIVLMSAGLVILILALINFININIALISYRTKEIGIRKISGAHQFVLFIPFILESVIQCLLAFFLSRIFIELLFGNFNNLIEFGLNRDVLSNPVFILITVISAIFIGIISGSIPLFYINQYKTIKILKEGVSKGTHALFLRKGLIIFQFSITIILLVTSILIKKQLVYIRVKDLGFKKENCIEIPIGSLNDHKDAFKNDILQWPHVSGYALSSLGIGSANEWGGKLNYKDATKEIQYYIIHCDEQYADVMGFEFTNGRNFSIKIESDKEGVILNTTAVKEYGIEDPLEANINGYPVIGVIKDFHIRSLHERVGSVALIYQSEYADFATIRIDKNSPEVVIQTLNYFNQMWKKYNPDESFEYRFLDQRVEQFYKKEKIQFKVFSYFSIIAVLLAALGLFGISTISIELRTKEIGIRKVNGASVFNILNLLFRDFTLLVFISILFACPISWYLLTYWLKGFAYKTSLSLWIFILAGTISISIAWITILWESLKAARRNPIDSLRYE